MGQAQHFFKNQTGQPGGRKTNHREPHYLGTFSGHVVTVCIRKQKCRRHHIEVHFTECIKVHVEFFIHKIADEDQ